MRGLILPTLFAIFILLQISCQEQQLYMLPTESMEPTIKKGQRVNLIHKEITKDFPKRWDLVAYRGKKNEINMFRVIGLPGETISFDDGKYTIDGAPLDLPTELSGINYEWKIFNPIGKVFPFPYTIPSNSYFLVGDNPPQSNDSRYQGAIPASDIIGKIEIK